MIIDLENDCSRGKDGGLKGIKEREGETGKTFMISGTIKLQ